MVVVNEDGMTGTDGWGSGTAVVGGGKVIVTVEGVSGGYEKFVGLAPRS